MSSFRPLLPVFFALLVLSAPPSAHAEIRADFAAWLTEFRAEAREKGISDNTLDAALEGVQPVERIIQRDRSQAEFKLDLNRYYSRVATKQTVARGKTLLRENAPLLKQVSDKYGVQPRFIVAIWGIETRYGRVRGSMPVVPALATLAFDRRRSKFFRNELIQALRMVDRGYIELENMKGSWAGAMGQSQFIPSSYMAYAVDFDGDGRRDIWETRADVFGSIANYLKEHRWDRSATWGRKVALPDGFDAKLKELGTDKDGSCRALRGITPRRSLAEWQAMGVRRADGRDLPTRDIKAALVPPSQSQGAAFLVYDNYRSILRYNCAHLYGLTVGMLADAISRP